MMASMSSSGASAGALREQAGYAQKRLSHTRRFSRHSYDGLGSIVTLLSNPTKTFGRSATGAVMLTVGTYMTALIGLLGAPDLSNTSNVTSTIGTGVGDAIAATSRAMLQLGVTNNASLMSTVSVAPNYSLWQTGYFAVAAGTLNPVLAYVMIAAVRDTTCTLVRGICIGVCLSYDRLSIRAHVCGLSHINCVSRPIIAGYAVRVCHISGHAAAGLGSARGAVRAGVSRHCLLPLDVEAP